MIRKIFACVSIAFLLVLVGLLITLKNATRIRTEVVADRVSFMVGDSEKIRGNKMMLCFDSLTIHHFSGIDMEPESISESAKNGAKTGGPIKILAESERLNPAVTIERALSGKGRKGILEIDFSHPHTRVVIEVTSKNEAMSQMGVLIGIEGENMEANLNLIGEYALYANHTHFSGLIQKNGQNSSSFHALFSEKHPNVRINGKSQYLTLNVVVSTNDDVFKDISLPLERIEFVRLNQEGEVKSTVKKDGSVQFPEYPKIPEKKYVSGSFVFLENPENDFGIYNVSLDKETAGLRFAVEGTVRVKIREPSAEGPKDYLPSLYDLLMNGDKWWSVLQIMTIAVFIIGCISGLAKLFMGKKNGNNG